MSSIVGVVSRNGAEELVGDAENIGGISLKVEGVKSKSKLGTTILLRSFDS